MQKVLRNGKTISLHMFCFVSAFWFRDAWIQVIQSVAIKLRQQDQAESMETDELGPPGSPSGPLEEAPTVEEAAAEQASIASGEFARSPEMRRRRKIVTLFLFLFQFLFQMY